MAKFYKSFEEKRGLSELEIPEQLTSEEIKETDGKLKRFLKNKSVRGFQGHSIYDVGRFFLRAIVKEATLPRANSLSFNFTLAIFPSILCLLTFMAYLPVKGIKNRMILELGKLLPESTYESLKSTINEIFNIKHGGLLSFGFLLALYFASNAFHSIINNFNKTIIDRVPKSWLVNRYKAVYITLIIGALVIVSLLLLNGMVQVNVWFRNNNWFSKSTLHSIFSIVEYLVLIVLIFSIISSIYYFAPNKEDKWRFFSPGSVFAGVLSILSTLLFSLYVNNFGAYNKVYGSIGAIIALMVLVYINTNVLLAGFELNNSIDKATAKKQDEAVAKTQKAK